MEGQIEDRAIVHGWVVKRNRASLLHKQAWRYLLFRGRKAEGKDPELCCFYADHPGAEQATEVFNWESVQFLSFSLSDPTMSPSKLSSAIESPPLENTATPTTSPLDLQWLVMRFTSGGVPVHSFMFGCEEASQITWFAKRLINFGVPPQFPLSPSIYGGIVRGAMR